MDVHCTTCGEPWDVYHLRHEAVFETTLAEEEAQAWRSLPQARQLSSRYRAEFRAVGWEFGRTMINVVHCPFCPREAEAKPKLLQAKAELEAMLEDDPDGLAATFEDLDL